MGHIRKNQPYLLSPIFILSKQYGLINSRANISAFSQDSSFSLLSALEVLGDEGQLERKADIFYKRTIKPHTPVTSVDTSSEALAVSVGEKARVDMDYMCELTGKTEEEIFADLKGVIFLNPMHGYGNSAQAKYLMADEYLSGNVREKLVLARKSAELYPEDYTVNVEALERVQPKDLTANEIAVRLGATWLPTEIVEQFMFEFLGTPRYAQWNIKVHFSAYTGEWNIEGKSYDRSNVKAYSTCVIVINIAAGIAFCLAVTVGYDDGLAVRDTEQLFIVAVNKANIPVGFFDVLVQPFLYIAEAVEVRQKWQS